MNHNQFNVSTQLITKLMSYQHWSKFLIQTKVLRLPKHSLKEKDKIKNSHSFRNLVFCNNNKPAVVGTAPPRPPNDKPALAVVVAGVPNDGGAALPKLKPPNDEFGFIVSNCEIFFFLG